MRARRSVPALLALFLALTSPALAQRIEAPSGPVPPYTLAEVKVVDLPRAAFDITPLGLTTGEPSGRVVDGGTAYLFTAPPGRYKVMALGVAGGEPVILSAIVTFEGAGPTPPTPPVPPGPEPPVPPGPTPVPTPDFGPPARVLLLYETSEMTGREPFTGEEFRDSMISLVGADGYRHWDYDIDPGLLPGWSEAKAEAMSEHGPAEGPAVFVWDKAGKMRVVEPAADQTTEAFVAAIKGGK